MGPENESKPVIFMSMGRDGVWHKVDEIPVIDFDSLSDADLADPNIFGDLSVQTMAFSPSLQVCRLLGLEPLPRRLTRRRLVKLLMSYEIPRDAAMAIARAGLEALGSYAAVWRDVVLSSRTP